MANFISFPGTVVPFSSKTPEEGIEWAKTYADQLQSSYPASTYVTVIYNNLKTNEFGQVLSSRYGDLVKEAFGLESVERVFINTLAVAGQGGDMSINYEQLAQAVSQQIVDQLPESGVTVAEIDAVVSQRLEPIREEVQLAIDHARAANVQTKASVG